MLNLHKVNGKLLEQIQQGKVTQRDLALRHTPVVGPEHPRHTSLMMIRHVRLMMMERINGESKLATQVQDVLIELWDRVSVNHNGGKPDNRGDALSRVQYLTKGLTEPAEIVNPFKMLIEQLGRDSCGSLMNRTAQCMQLAVRARIDEDVVSTLTAYEHLYENGVPEAQDDVPINLVVDAPDAQPRKMTAKDWDDLVSKGIQPRGTRPTQ